MTFTAPAKTCATKHDLYYEIEIKQSDQPTVWALRHSSLEEGPLVTLGVFHTRLAAMGYARSHYTDQRGPETVGDELQWDSVGHDIEIGEAAPLWELAARGAAVIVLMAGAIGGFLWLMIWLATP